MQSLAKEAVEHGAGGAVLVGDFDLPEDLALTGHERVESGRDPEQVQGGGVATEPVEVGRCRQSVDGESFGRIGVGVDGIDLRAVARREAHDLGALRRESVGELPRAFAVEGHALANLDGRQAVRGADENDAHAK
jgi:hypothetical protein